MVSLDGSVRLVSLQFSFSNSRVVPLAIRWVDRETLYEQDDRHRHRKSGTMVIEPTEKSSLVEFLGELEGAGYELVDALCQERPHPKNPRQIYSVVRFLFARCEFVDLSDEFKKVRDNIRAKLSEMCRVAMWRVRAFSNPFYENGEEVAGQRALSINLEAREPLFRPDGQPVTRWQKDEEGERVGDAPLPIKPDYRLRILSDTVQLVTA